MEGAQNGRVCGMGFPMRKPVFTPEERVALALRLLDLLSDAPQCIDDLAGLLGVKRDHIYKMITTLAKEGWLISKRGRTGGGIFRKPGIAATSETLKAVLYKSSDAPKAEAVFGDHVYTPLSVDRPEQLTQRRCRKCSARLPQSRYYNCYECQPVLPQASDDMIYCYAGGSEKDEPHG